MPTVNGTVYAAARERGRDYNVLNVLILGAPTGELRAFLEQLKVLHVYISNTLGVDVCIKIHGTDDFDVAIAKECDVILHPEVAANESLVLKLAQKFDIDITFDQHRILSERYIQDNFYMSQTVHSIDGLVSSCEDFLIGNDISWLFSNVTWNLPLLMRYFDRPGICKDYFTFMGECVDTKKYSVNQQERVRYISNRISQVEYSKDMLQSYIKRMRKSERNGYAHQDYNFELNYHLSNYYFLIAGVLDSMARLLNDVFGLQLTRHSLALEKVEFINANRRRRTGLVRILSKKDFAEWAKFLKERRNFIAHDGDMRQTSVVAQKDVLLTEDEVERLVDEQSNWPLIAQISPPERVRGLRSLAAQLIRVEHDFKTVSKNVMVVSGVDGYKLYYPLRSVEYDYGKLTQVLVAILERLKR